ncbi:hypothetical protein POM88_018005 [Heracleum sosnowskyi]|uniref:S1 motif domain-containing protein n=1 Tax=Heracleum sosnowskyi TaxID=360622 RepID=A0AAD8IPR0_9APIA|nr:hypothetical protein POM88_018005 [Heracleum sosnowskyi]
MPMFLTTQLASSSASSSLCFHSSDSTSLFLQPRTYPNPSSILCRQSFSIYCPSSSRCISRVSTDRAAAAAGPVTNSPSNDVCKIPLLGCVLLSLATAMSHLGLLPFRELSPYHSCKEPNKSIQDIARALTGSLISVKVIQVDETNERLILSEKEDYGAFLHLRFSDGCYHLTGLVHISEVTWDLVEDVRDVLHEGDEVRNMLTGQSRGLHCLKELEEDPVVRKFGQSDPKDGSVGCYSSSEDESCDIEPLQGLETIIEELLQEDGCAFFARKNLNCFLNLSPPSFVSI